MLHEMAKLNFREDSNSIFPSDKYRIWVQTDTSLSKVPNVYISSQKDNWELKVHIETCEIIYCHAQARLQGLQADSRRLANTHAAQKPVQDFSQAS